jgi:hypothetical protein
VGGGNLFRPEHGADGGLDKIIEDVLTELGEDAGLTDRAVPDNDDFGIEILRFAEIHSVMV